MPVGVGVEMGVGVGVTVGIGVGVGVGDEVVSSACNFAGVALSSPVNAKYARPASEQSNVLLAAAWSRCQTHCSLGSLEFCSHVN